jgi:Lysozyme like domain
MSGSEWVILGILVIVGFGAVAKGVNLLSGSPLNANQIANFAQIAGFGGNALITAVAIALAESSGNPSASGDSGASYGLWQIDSQFHPEFGTPTSSWYDPQINANMAYSVYVAAGNSFSPWSTFINGQYASFLSTVTQSLGA